MAHAAPRGADHFCERLLTYVRYVRLWLTILAEVRREEEDTRQTLLAGIKELVDQVLLNSGVSRQQVRYEHLGEFRLVVKHASIAAYSIRMMTQFVTVTTVATRRRCPFRQLSPKKSPFP